MRKLNLRDTLITVTASFSLLAAGSAIAQGAETTEQPATSTPSSQMEQQNSAQAGGQSWGGDTQTDSQTNANAFGEEETQTPSDDPYAPQEEEEEEATDTYGGPYEPAPEEEEEEEATGTFGDDAYNPSTEEEEEEEASSTFGDDAYNPSTEEEEEEAPFGGNDADKDDEDDYQQDW